MRVVTVWAAFACAAALALLCLPDAHAAEATVLGAVGLAVRGARASRWFALACTAVGLVSFVALSARGLVFGGHALKSLVVPLGVGLSHAWVWASDASSARGGSLLHKLEQESVIARAALAVFALSSFAFAARRSALAFTLMVAALMTACAVAAQAASQLSQLISLSSAATPRDPAEPGEPQREIDLGVGDAQHWLGARAGVAYRGVRGAQAAIRGDLQAAIERAKQLLRRTGVIVLLGTGAFATVLWSTRVRPPPHKPLSRPGPAQLTPAPQGASSWYPQPKPLLFDANGDGHLDVIGLRWDAEHDGGALSVAANDGRTLARLWQTPGFPAQWGSRHNRVELSGEHVFVTDSEGIVRVFSARTGARTGEARWHRADEICAAPAPFAPALLLRDLDADKGRELTLIGADAAPVTPLASAGMARTEVSAQDLRGARPPWCPRRPTGEGCRNSAEVRCGGAPPAFVAREGRDSRTVLHAGELGVVITRAERDSPHGYGQVIGFTAATGEPRFREPLLKSGDAVDAASDVDLALSFDRLFVTYRLTTGPSRVLARNARTGAELWSVLPPAVGTGISAIYAGADRLFLRVDDALLVLDARSGASVGTIH